MGWASNHRGHLREALLALVVLALAFLNFGHASAVFAANGRIVITAHSVCGDPGSLPRGGRSLCLPRLPAGRRSAAAGARSRAAGALLHPAGGLCRRRAGSRRWRRSPSSAPHEGRPPPDLSSFIVPHEVRSCAQFAAALLAALVILSTVTLSPPPSPIWSRRLSDGPEFYPGPITVTGAYARATPKGAPTAGAYFTVANAGAAPDTLVGASSGAASDLALHEMKMNGNVMEMDPLAGGLAIPAGASVSLDPMTDHLMLTGLSAPLVEGQCLKMVLHFAKAGDLPVELNIGGFGQSAPPTASPGASVMPSGAMDMDGMSSMAM